jgi:ABC-type multidrug transport system ATPase subunit
MDGVEAEDNRFIGNRLGIYVDSSPNAIDVYNHFTRNRIAFNDVGVALLPMVKRNLFHDNSFDDNQEQVAVLGNGSLEGNSFTVDGRGNYWSDYRGYDKDGDGIGDLPYRSQSFFENLMDRQPKLRLFVYSPAQQALEMTSRAVPSVQPRPKFQDDAPLLRAAPLNVPAQTAGFGWPAAGAGTALILAAALVVLVAINRPALRTARESSAAAVAVEPIDEPKTFARSQHVEALPSSVLVVKDLTKRFGRFVAVDGLSFELGRGQAVALWGSNGAGKTTAIRCIMGLIRSRGHVSIAGRDLRRSGRALRAMIGYVPQESCFQGDLTVAEALRLYAHLKAAPASRCTALLAEVGLADHTAKRVAELSGGMRKRLALAAALLNDPPLLILDEIAANLDAEARRSFMALLVHLKGRGKSILFTSHRLDEVQTLADRVLVLRRGRLEKDCEPSELAATLGLRCDVRFVLPERLIAPAMDLLTAEGFAARRNGHGVWVRVEADRKAAPIHVLARNRIVVDNFEVDSPETQEDSHV